MSTDYYYFKPNFWFGNGFIQTIIGSQVAGETYLPRRTVHKIKIEKQSKLVLFELDSNNIESSIILLAHGMGGSSESCYMLRIARKLWMRGLKVFMMNQRGCGLGMGLSERLWNGGISGDLHKVIEYISKIYPNRPINVVGFSLSGNILLKYLGEKRSESLKVKKAFAVNPPIDLKISSYILSKTRVGLLFNKYYMRQIKRQTQALVECFPGVLAPSGNEKTILEFDDAYTAPSSGYKDADDYYLQCSSKNYLQNITTPTTILCSEDDPFIRSDIFKSVRMSNSIEIFTPEYGGHLGYICSEPTPWGDYRWMDFKVVDWAGEDRKAR